MAIILCANQNNIKQNILDQLNENSVVFSNDYYAGKQFIKQQASEKYEYYYLYQNNVYFIERMEEIINLQRLFLIDENYNEAKNFNEFLINVSRIKKLKQWLYYPMIIQLEHTNRCNARCIMCAHANVDKKKCFDMPDSTFSKIERLLPFCKYVGLHGYGEPFLTKNLIEKFEIYKKYGVRLYANTNLSYLPKVYLPYIAEMFDEINISIDGFTKQTFDTIRQGLKYENVKANIKVLTTNCPHVHLNVHTTLMRQNILECKKAIDFAYENGVKKVVFNEMIPLAANDNQDDSIRNYPAATSFMLKLAIGRATELGINVEYPHQLIGNYIDDEIQQEIDLIKQMNCYKGSLKIKKGSIVEKSLLFNRRPLTKRSILYSGIKCKGICDVFQQQIYVDADGTMAVCCVDGYHSIGNINAFENLIDYWNSSIVLSLRNSFSKGKLPLICKQCNYIYLGKLNNLQIL